MDINIAHNACSEKKYELALKIFSKIAEHKNPEAIIGLGFLYENGFGVIQNKRFALSLYQNAEKILKINSKNGNIKANYLLGDWYFRGAEDWYFQNKDKKEIKKKGLELITYAADHGETNAMYDLFNYYNNKIIKSKNIRLSAANDNAPKINLNFSKEAFTWLRLSAEYCHPIGMYNLGQFYRIGQLVQINHSLSLKWLSLAHIKFKKNGDAFMISLALDYIRLVKSFLKPQEIFDVQNLASLFLEKNKNRMNESFSPVSVNFIED